VGHSSTFPVPPIPLTPPPQPSNPQFCPFPVNHLAPLDSHAILSRVRRIPSPPTVSHPHLATISSRSSQPSNLPTCQRCSNSLKLFPSMALTLSLTDGPRKSFVCNTYELPASVANKRLTEKLTPLPATLTKNRGVGVAAFQRFSRSARSTGSAAPQILNGRQRFPHTS
jgi:hypothetical protein